ncbi:hypothetical protein ACJX0J_022782, partial [Zea mays]
RAIEAQLIESGVAFIFDIDASVFRLNYYNKLMVQRTTAGPGPADVEQLTRDIESLEESIIQDDLAGQPHNSIGKFIHHDIIANLHHMNKGNLKFKDGLHDIP